MEILQYLFVGLPYLVAFALAVALILFLLSACRSPTAGLVLTGLLCWFDTLLPGAGPLHLGINIFLPDILCGMVAMAAVLRAVFASAWQRIPVSWLLFVAVVALSFALGISAYGTAAGGALRPYFYAVAVASYFMTFPVDDAMVRRVLVGFSLIGFGVLAVVFFRWVVVAVPIGALLPPGGSFDPTGASMLRVITAEQAAVLAGVLVVGLFYAQSRGLLRTARLLLPLMAVAVIGLQHRSVWLAVLAAVGARFMLPAAGRRGGTQLAGLALVLAVIAVPAVMSGRLGGVAHDITKSANRAVALDDTANVRLESWKFAINKWRDGGPRALLVGLPLGTPMDRYMVTSTNQLRLNTFQAHDYFVQTLFSFGLVGLITNLFFYARTLVRLYRLAPLQEGGAMASALLLLLVLQMAFYLTYGVAYMQGLVLGLAVSYAVTHSRRQAGTRATPRLSAFAQRLAAQVRPGLR